MSDAATSNAPSPFVAYLRGMAGTNLHAVVQYDDSGQELLYDGGENVPPEPLVADLRESEREETRRTAIADVGSLHAVLRVYDGSLLVHVPQGEAVGTLVALDPAELRGLSGFVRGALLRLPETGQTVEAVPERH
jgi:hypothetical protein